MAGPGYRFCLWVQGCSRHCPGCEAKDTWSYSDGISLDTETLIKQITDTPGIEGLSLLGGEPFDQAAALALLAGQARDKGLSVVTFSGYTHEELCAANDPYIQQLLDATDLLIDGPFAQEEFDLSRPWVGSCNQRFIFLTDRYNEHDLLGVHNQIEIRIAPNGKTLVNGMGDFAEIRKLL